MGASFRGDDRAHATATVGPQYCRAVLGRLFRTARGPTAFRPAFRCQISRFGPKRPQRREIAAAVDLHQGLAG
jgi:hypothetical protein